MEKATQLMGVPFGEEKEYPYTYVINEDCEGFIFTFDVDGEKLVEERSGETGFVIKTTRPNKADPKKTDVKEYYESGYLYVSGTCNDHGYEGIVEMGYKDNNDRYFALAVSGDYLKLAEGLVLRDEKNEIVFDSRVLEELNNKQTAILTQKKKPTGPS